MSEMGSMRQECLATADRLFLEHAAPHGADEPLTQHLLYLCRQWGPLTASLADMFYLRATTSSRLGVDAKTGVFDCTHDGQSHLVPYIFVGSRLYYFIWRINMVCATAWDVESDPGSKQNRLVPNPHWPRRVHIEQARQSIRMYFRNEPFINTDGLNEFNEQIAGTTAQPLILFKYTVDLAELFVLLHEIQHHIPLEAYNDEAMGLQVHLPVNLQISPRRARWWEGELTRDGNAVGILLGSVAEVLADTTDLSPDAARTQAASIVFGGADAALDAIQRLEEIRLGKIPLTQAAFTPEFVRHPPSQFRRNSMSATAYRLVTGNQFDPQRRGVHPAQWQFVAQNLYQHMVVRDRLFSAMTEMGEENGSDD